MSTTDTGISASWNPVVEGEAEQGRVLAVVERDEERHDHRRRQQQADQGTSAHGWMCRGGEVGGSVIGGHLRVGRPV